MTTGSDVLRSLNIPTLEDIKWVQCPCCGEEWTNLMSCEFWNQGMHVEKLCVRCGEGIKNFEWIMHHYPAETEMAFNLKKSLSFLGVKDELTPKSGYYATVDHKEKTFVLTCREGDFPIKVEHDGVETFHKNTVAAWMAIRKKINQKPDTVKGVGW